MPALVSSCRLELHLGSSHESDLNFDYGVWAGGADDAQPSRAAAWFGALLIVFVPSPSAATGASDPFRESEAIMTSPSFRVAAASSP